jgi:hypothetical protein
MFMITASAVFAATYTYTIVKETKIFNGKEIAGVHYTDTDGNDETVIVSMLQVDAKNTTKVAYAVDKEVQKVMDSRLTGKHSIKNDPALKANRGQKTITIKE